MKRSGKCLCGAVSFVAELGEHQLSTCHCGMCLRWAGGPFMGLGTQSVSWTGEQHIKTYASSEIAERGFCAECGSNLFYRLIAPGPYHGFTSIAFGTLDEREGIELTREWFYDNKPSAYTFAGERARVTEAEALAMLEA